MVADVTLSTLFVDVTLSTLFVSMRLSPFRNKMKAFGMEFSRHQSTRKKIIFSSRKQEQRVRDVVDILAGEHPVSPPLKELKIPRYIDSKGQLAQLQNSPIPFSAAGAIATRDTKGDEDGNKQSQLPISMKTVSFSRNSAGFSSKGETRSSIKFDQLVKSRAEEVKAVRLLAENTAKNVAPSHSLTNLSTPAQKTNIQDVNSKWQDMMIVPSPASSASTREGKTRRCISFDEKVICHNILRIKDIIEEYDAFEKDFLAECETRMAEMESSANLVLADRKKDTSNNGNKSASYNDTQTHEPMNFDVEFEMTMEEIIATQIMIPDSLSRQDDIFRESRLLHHQHHEYEDSITSMAPACPTPDRSLSPSENGYDYVSSNTHVSYITLDESTLDKGQNQFRDIESLFNGSAQDTAHQTIAVPVISLVASNRGERNGLAISAPIQQSSESTLLSISTPMVANSQNSAKISDGNRKGGFWTSFFSRVFGRHQNTIQKSAFSSKVHPM